MTERMIGWLIEKLFMKLP